MRYLIIYLLVAVFLLPAAEIQWHAGNGLENWKGLFRLKCEYKHDLLVLTSIGYDSAIWCDQVRIDSEKLNTLEITYRATGIRAKTTGQLYYKNDRGRFSDSRRWNLPSMKGDGKWHTMRVTTSDLSDPESWSRGGIITQLRIDMADSPGGKIEISKIRFFYDPDVRPPKSMTEQLDGPVWKPVKPDFLPLPQKKISVPYFCGSMITHPRDTGKKAIYHLRKTFVLEDVPEYALLQFIADDRGVVYLNGKRALSVSTWEKTQSADVTKLLQKGQNIFAIEYENDKSAGGALADIQIILKNGKLLRVGTDKKFKALPVLKTGWTTCPPDSKDLAVTVNAPPPAAPWTKQLFYRDISTRLKFAGVKLDKTHYFSGETVQTTVVLIGKRPPLPTAVMLYQKTQSGLQLPPQEITLTKENTTCFTNKKWSFTAKVKLPQTLRDTTIQFHFQTAWHVDKEIKINVPYQNRKSFSENGNAIRTEVRKTPEGPRFFLNGKMVYPAISCIPRNSGPDPMQLDFRVLFPVSDWWIGKDHYDFSAFDLAVEQALKDYPDVLFFVQISTHPPVSWAKENPSEMAVTENGRISGHLKIGETPHSFSSAKALEDKRNAVRACIRYLESSPYANRIAGYRIIGGHTAEWIGWGYMHKWLFDYSRPAQDAFREYIAKNHPESGITEIPSEQERLTRLDGISSILDPGQQLAVIAYNRFYSASIADMLIELCKTAREASNNRKIIGSYYGYTLNTSSTPYFHVAGHYDLMRVLKSGAVDFLMSPQSYAIRHLGGTMGDMKPFQTIANHGVISLIENDMRTHALPSIWTNNYDQTLNAAQSLGIMGRDFGIALCRLQPVLLYTYYGKYHSEFSFPEMRPLMSAVRKAGDFCYNKRIRRKADIAFVVSEQSLNHLAYEKKYIRTGSRRQNFNHTGGVGNFPESALRLTGSLIAGQIDPLSRSGATCDYILAEDIANHLDDYKLWIFTDCIRYDDAFLSAVKELRKRKTTLFWLYAPGYCYKDQNSLQNMKELTGFTFGSVPSASAEILLKSGKYIGIKGEQLTPAFYVVEQDGVRSHGNYAGTDLCGFAEKKEGKSRSIFCGTYRFSAAEFRELAKKSGAHIYLESGDPIEANEGLFSLHARWEGRKTIHLKQKTDVIDVFNRRMIATGTDSFTFHAPLHSSWLFYCGPDAGELLRNLKKD